MLYSEYKCNDFIEVLSSKAAVPGGGGAAALVGSIGMALGSMVCNLTIGKKKYAQYEDKIVAILENAKIVEKELLIMIDRDAENFLPLSKAYGMSANNDEEINLKEETLEKALKQACEVPVQIVEIAYKAIKLHEELVDICSRLVISDVGVGVQCLRAALVSGWLNVMININSIKDVEYIDKIKKEIEPLIGEGIKIVDKVYEEVKRSIS